MALVPTAFKSSAYLTTSNVTQYTVPANQTALVTALTLFNSSGSVVTANVYLVPSGGSADGSNQIFGAITPLLAGRGTQVDLALRRVLNTGDTIVASASAGTSINIAISGSLYSAS